MKASSASREGIPKSLRNLTLFTVASLLTGLLPSYAAAQSTGKQSEAQLRVQWQKDIGKVPLPKKGCFSASYPKKEWKEVPCTPPSKFPNPPRSGPRPNVVGNGNDISAQVTGLLISSVVGSFDSVTPATVTETGAWNGNPTSPNAFTLQINSQFFPTSVCGGVAGCVGWQQFIYSQNQCSGPCVFMEYWLINFGSSCPAGPWNQAGNSCWFNSASSAAPGVTAAQLQGTTITGNAGAATDSVVLTSPGGSATAIAADSVVNLSQSWTTAEWNIFGDCCGTQANFSAGTAIVPRVTLNDGSQQAPACLASGFTGETNNLSFGPTAPASSGAGPALLFSQSSAGGAPSNCMAATSVGDTHLATFNGLFYDFQASGDFLLAQVDPDFVVQTRQVSGAPTWPDAAVNSAVATRMGKNKVAICLAPARLNIDGTNRDLADGSSVSTPDGVDVTRRGNVYFITDQSGNSVRATVNATWIDVSVGLGLWPAKVSGLLANANGNVNQIATRDGSVLTNPFSFEDLYHRYAESWRVSPRESMLSVCGGGIEPGIPRRPFYVKDLEQSVQAHALAVCTTAGVKPGPLLDACALDVAVIGHDEAAKVHVGAPTPVAVGNPVVATSTTGAASGTGSQKWWMWGVLLLILIVFLLWIILKRRKTP